MNKRMTDHDLERLLAGEAPLGRPELRAVAASIAAFRSAAQETVPRPSQALRARLDLSGTSAQHTARSTRAAAAPAVGGAPTKEFTSMLTRIAGVRLAASISAATAALALGLVGAGAAGALPASLQNIFDSGAGSAEAPNPPAQQDVTDNSTDNFGDDVRGYQDVAEGREFGQLVAENARLLRAEMTSNLPANANGSAAAEKAPDVASNAPVELPVTPGPGARP
jgi:hypothetical protein